MFDSIKEYKERGPVYWKVCHNSIRGGIIKLTINKNRIVFDKNFILYNDEDFNIALNICKNKATRIIHMKNTNVPELGRLASYCIEATDVISMEDK